MYQSRRAFLSTAAALSALAAFTPTAEATTPLCVGIFGQSLAQPLFQHPGVDFVVAEFARSGYAATVLGSGAGGSSILKERANASTPTYYWWDSDAHAPGPLLTAALNAIAASPVKPVTISMQCGDQDALSGLPFDAERWMDGYGQVLWALRKACNPAVVQNNALMPTSMHFVTRWWGSGAAPGIQKVREAQIEFERRYSTVWGWDTYDLPVFAEDPLSDSEVGNRHPDEIGRALEAFRWVQSCLSMLGNANARMPPLAGSVTRSGATIRVPISSPFGGTFSKPTPDYFAYRVGSTVYTGADLEYVWSGSTLIITPPVAPVAGASLLYPYGELGTLDHSRIIVDQHGSPLRTLARTLT